MIRKTLGSLFVTPVSTRRNSMFYAMNKMRQMIHQSGGDLSVMTNTPGFNKETIYPNGSSIY